MLYLIYMLISDIFMINMKIKSINFYNEKAQEILKSLSLTVEGLEEKKAELIKKENKIEETDNKMILDKFYTGSLNINDYKEDNYKRIY